MGSMSGEGVSDMKSYKVGKRLFWSKRQMLEAFGVTAYKFDKLVDSGMSVDDVLDTLTKENVRKRYKENDTGAVNRKGVKRNKYVIGDSNYVTLKDVSDAYGIAVGTLKNRLDLGMTIDEAVTGRYRIRPVRGRSKTELEEMDYYVEYERARYVSMEDFLRYFGVRIGDYARCLEVGYGKIAAMDRLRGSGRSKS